MSRRTHWSADELLAATFPAPRWAVPGLLPEGLSLLVGPPKVGKSWLALDVAVAVASGAEALGRVPCEQGDVLYLALEDTPQRLQSRLRKVIGDAEPPRRLTVATECPPLDAGGAEALDAWLAAHPGARLVVVDVLARVRGRAPASGTQYEADYAPMITLKQLADRHAVALLPLHHTRKAASEDFLDAVSGTQGLAGASDSVLVLRRSRGQADALLALTGRDVEEGEHALHFDSGSGRWTIMDGPAGDYAMPPGRTEVLRLLREAGPRSPKLVAAALGLTPENARQLLRRMAVDGQLITRGDGSYAAMGSDTTPLSRLSHLSPLSPVTSSERDNGSGEVTAVTAAVAGVSLSQLSPVTPPPRSADPSSLISLSQSLATNRDSGDRCDTPERGACHVCGEPLEPAAAAGGFRTHPGCAA